MGPSDHVFHGGNAVSGQCVGQLGDAAGRPAPGSRKIAVPMPTTDAPAAANSTQSWAFSTPPMPTIGSPVAARAWKIACSATGFTAGPDSPPPPPPSSGRSVARSIAIPRTVLISTSPSLPPSAAASAIAETSATLGRQLGQQRPVGLGPAALEQRPRLGGVGADRDAAGLDVRAGRRSARSPAPPGAGRGGRRRWRTPRASSRPR